METIKDIIERFKLVKEDTQTTVITKDWIKSVVLDNLDKIVEELGVEIND